MPMIDDIIKLKNEDHSNKEIAAALDITPQKVVAMLRQQGKADEPKEDKPKAVAAAIPAYVPAEVVEPTGIQIHTPEEYFAQNVAAGRAPMGGHIGKEAVPTLEVLRGYLNSHYPPSHLVYIWNLKKATFERLVLNLSRSERRERDLRVNWAMDTVR